jgi:glycine dehydrogenase subunit 1
MSYLPHTDLDRRAMLDTIGIASTEELYHTVPKDLRVTSLELPEGISEWEVQQEMGRIAARNDIQYANFLGAGCYNRYIPSAVDAILQRSEFYTAFTPYQPEISQRTLQAIYEFQSQICLLTGMDVANASMYDGASATAEAALMALRVTGRHEILVADSVHPEYRQVIRTYGAKTIELPTKGGVLDNFDIPETAAGLIVQVPNFFGALEDVRALSERIHAKGGLLVVVVDPVSLALLEAPGAYGADIVVGDGQSLGNPMYFGGPHLGFMATKDKLARQLPGRIVGATVDARGDRVFTLTLQTREQHIRREKATSNICSNQGLCALAATIYLSLLGKEGLAQVANVSLQRAHHLASQIAQMQGFKIRYQAPFFHEFVVEAPMPAKQLLASLKNRGILGGVALDRWYPELDHCILVAVTEANSTQEIQRYLEALEACRKEAEQLAR